MSQGWICVHRKLLEWEWFDDHNTFRLFMYFMLKANHQDKNWKGILIKRGQHLTSLDKIVAGSGLSKSQIRTAINKLKSTREIAHDSNAQHTVITIINYDLYQASDTQNSTPVAHESHTNDTPMTPNNNDNNGNNENKKDTRGAEAPKQEPLFSTKSDIKPSLVKELYNDMFSELASWKAKNASRETRLRNFIKSRQADVGEFNMAELETYFICIKTECQWMLEKQNGYKAKNIDFFLSEKCWAGVFEGSYRRDQQC